jgi:hypothetical protein
MAVRGKPTPRTHSKKQGGGLKVKRQRSIESKVNDCPSYTLTSLYTIGVLGTIRGKSGNHRRETIQNYST